MIGIKIDVRGLADVRQRLQAIPAELREKALQPAINRVAEKARAEINRALPEVYAVKASEVRSAIEIRRAARGVLRAEVTIFGSASKRGRSANLIRFLAAYQAAGQAMKTRGAKLSKSQMAGLQRQLGFMIKRGGGLKQIEGAFIGNKGRTVFQRISGAQMASRPGALNKHSQAIDALQVIGFSQMFNSRKISGRIRAKINADLPVEIDRAIAATLARAQL